MRSDAATVEGYLQELPEERRAAIQAVRNVILENLPNGYEEVMNWGMITYQVPLSQYADTYNKKPLMYAALASQKNHMAIYLTAIYLDEVKRRNFEEEIKASGKKLDAGKSCIRFRRLDDLPLQLIGQAIASFDMESFIRKVKETRVSQGKAPKQPS